MFRSTTALLVAGGLFLSGCESGTAPGPQLGDADADALSAEADAMLDGMLNELFGGFTGGAAAAEGPALVDVVVTWSFERTRTCRAGGTATLAGEGTRERDDAAGTVDHVASGTKTRDACGFVRGDVTITVVGSGEWTHERHFLDRAPTGTWVTTWVGEFDWAKSTGQGGTCSHDLTKTIDTATNTVTLVGTHCGRDIDRSRTWRNPTP